MGGGWVVIATLDINAIFHFLPSCFPFVQPLGGRLNMHDTCVCVMSPFQKQAAPAHSAPRVLSITLRDVQSWAAFMSVAITGCDLEPWAAYLHGAGMVLLDGLALGTGLSVKDVDGVRRAAYDFLTRQIPDERRRHVAALLDTLALGGGGSGSASGSGAGDVAVTDSDRGVFGMRGFFIPLGPVPVPKSLPYALGAPTTAKNLVRAGIRGRVFVVTRVFSLFVHACVSRSE